MANLVFAGTGHVFPSIVRRLNMLRPSRWAYTGEIGGIITTSWTSANYFKDWIPFNLQAYGGANVDTASFGAFTTAPDGTTDTARKLVESDANSEHSFIATYPSQSGNGQGKLRLAGVFKYAGRRVILTMQTQPTGGLNENTVAGCRAVFDLLNGQVAVDTALFGIAPAWPWTLYPAQMQAIGNGWYLCYIDVCVNTQGMSTVVFSKVALDAGLGTDVAKSSYRGNGTSGVYAWRSNMLPSRTWDLSEVIFFDDFDDDTKANMDVNDTRAPGYDWYFHNEFAAYANADPVTGEGGFYNPPTDPDNIVVSGSVLSLGPHPYPLGMASCADTWVRGTPPPSTPTPGNPNMVGWAVVGGAMWEARARWDATPLGITAGGNTLWTSTFELTSNRANPGPGRECDFFEVLYGGPGGGSHVHYYQTLESGYIPPSHQVAAGFTHGGVSTWYSQKDYPLGRSAAYLGVRYTTILHADRRDIPPPDDPTYWGPYVQGDDSAIKPIIEIRDFHTYTTLWFPWVSEGNPGQIMMFCDDEYVDLVHVYGPGTVVYFVDPADSIHPSDYTTMPVFLGPNPANTFDIDFVRITQ